MNYDILYRLFLQIMAARDLERYDLADLFWAAYERLQERLDAPRA
jgi:hypothetical protein